MTTWQDLADLADLHGWINVDDRWNRAMWIKLDDPTLTKVLDASRGPGEDIWGRGVIRRRIPMRSEHIEQLRVLQPNALRGRLTAAQMATMLAGGTP